jgi:Tfp pilus assembly protein PilX
MRTPGVDPLGSYKPGEALSVQERPVRIVLKGALAFHRIHTKGRGRNATTGVVVATNDILDLGLST